MAKTNSTHKVQQVLDVLRVSRATFGEIARTPESTVSRAARGEWIHARYMVRMIRASGGLLRAEDFGPEDEELPQIRGFLAA